MFIEEAHARVQGFADPYVLKAGSEKSLALEEIASWGPMLPAPAAYTAESTRALRRVVKHLKDRSEAIFVARTEQEKKGEEGARFVALLQKELDTLAGVCEFVETQIDKQGAP